MINALILIEGNSVDREKLKSRSLMNAKQFIVGNETDFGLVMHISATTASDLNTAILKFAEVDGVTGIATLKIHSIL